MEPTEMMAEIIQLRMVAGKMIEMAQERLMLYNLLASHGIIPIFFAQDNEDDDGGIE